MKQPRIFGVIMAGGAGTRFWPKSRKLKPKQFLSLVNKDSLIKNTADRLRSFIPLDDVYVVTTREQSDLILSHLHDLNPHNLILEPFGKNTAPCVGLAAIHLYQLDPDAVMVVLPADHWIRDVKAFHSALKLASEMANEHEALITIGITPTYPATGYGYIQLDDLVQTKRNLSVYKVKTFAEKPNLEVAQSFIESGDFVWNSGVFIWKVTSILREFEDKMPILSDGLMKIDAALGTKREQKTVETVYRQIRSESIDYGIMEHATNVLVIKGEFGWSDVGSWDEVYKVNKKDKNENVIHGNVICKEVSECLVDSGHRLTSLVGVNDLIIVDTPDALLICSKEKAQDVKEVVDTLRRMKMDKFL